MSFDTKLTWLAILALMLITGACRLIGSGTAPDDMSVEDHRRQSQEHATEANDHRDRYDPDVQIEPDPIRRGDWGRWGRDYEYRENDDYYWGGNSYNPTEHHQTKASEHEALAQRHREAARALERFEEAQCGSFPPETRPLCPLLGQLISVEDIPNGSRVRFADGIDMNAAIAHMRCHIAFARSRARSGMNSCPLYLEGVRVSRVGRGSDVDFLVEGSNELEMLRNRMRQHMAPDAR